MAKFIPENPDGSINSQFAWQNNSNLSFDENSEDIKRLIHSNNIHNKYESGLFDKFARFGVIDPFNAMTVTKEYVFITKPDLCLVQSDGVAQPILAKVPFFKDTISRYPEVANQLQYSVDAQRPFMNILSNSLTNTLDLPSISADTIETGANVWGTKISYRGTSHKSDEEFDFTLEFEDTKNLDVYTLFKLYDEYEKYKWAGGLNFTEAEGSYDRWKNYIKNKILYDAMSLYKFVVDEDGMRIIYWAKLTGCYPTSVPREAFSDMNNNDGQKISVGWKCHFVRDMDPMTIYEFNRLFQLSGGRRFSDDLPLYDSKNHVMNGEWASAAYIDIRDIQTPNGPTHREYYLKWKQ